MYSKENAAELPDSVANAEDSSAVSSLKQGYYESVAPRRPHLRRSFVLGGRPSLLAIPI